MSTAELALTRAQHLVEAKRFEAAATELRPALGDSATAGEAFCLLAQCQLGLARPKEAEASARSALAAGAAGEWPHRLLALSLLQREKTRKAVAAAAEAARQEPESAYALHIQTVALIAARKLKRALAIAEKNVATNPHAAVAFFTLGEAYAAFPRKKQQAEDAYRTALRLDPEYADAAFGLARILKRRRRRQEAGDVYLAAAAMDPSDNRARHGLAKLGLPVIAGGLAVSLKFAGYPLVQVGREVASLDLSVRAGAIGWLVAMTLGVLVTTWWRLRGGRSLPTHVREGLRADHRNAALAWGLTAGIGSILLGLIGLYADDRAFGAGLIALGVALVLIRERLRIGPRSHLEIKLATLPRRLGDRLRLLRGRLS